MVANGVPVVVLGTNCIATAADHLVARKDANIKKPEDLYGIKIGLLAGSTASAMLHNIAKRYNLDEKKLQPINLPPPEQLAGLNSGNVQALLCWQPWGFNAVKAGGELIHTGTTSHFEANKGPAGAGFRDALAVRREPRLRAQEPERRACADGGAGARTEICGRSGRTAPRCSASSRRRRSRTAALVEAIWGQYVFNPAVRRRLCRRHAIAWPTSSSPRDA